MFCGYWFESDVQPVMFADDEAMTEDVYASLRGPPSASCPPTQYTYVVLLTHCCPAIPNAPPTWTG